MTQTAVFIIISVLLFGVFVFLPKKVSTRRVGLLTLVVALLVELLVFQYHSYHLWFGDYGKVSYTAESEELTVAGGTGNTVQIMLNGISQPVGTLFFECKLEEDKELNTTGTPYVDVTVNAKDATHQASYRRSVADGRIVKGDANSAYIILDLSGDVTDLIITLTAKSGCTFAFEALTLNQAVPLSPSPLRLLLMVGAVMAIYALTRFPSMLGDYGTQRKRFRRLAILATALLIVVAAVMTGLYRYERTGGVISNFQETSGNQITQELVDAFAAGQVELLDNPSDELLSLNNPYDWSERQAAGISYKWDHLLFEGKYYSYYGIAPVLLLFLPYHLITGFYFPTPEAVFLFGALGILFLTLTYLAFCDLFCKKLPLNVLLSGLLICQLCSGVWYNFCSPLFYEIAQASGFCFTCAGFWLLLRSGVIGEGKIKKLSLSMSAVCLSLAVLCRPTLVLYCFASLLFLFFGLKKLLRNNKEQGISKPHRSVISYLACALAPFVLIGGVQMLYNYARFGSFFDFGIQYSLTINDFTRAEYHHDLAAIGFYNFFFTFPNIQPEFPFVFSNFSKLSVNGYYFVANRNAVGLFWRALPTLGYFAAIPTVRSLEQKERAKAILLTLATCVLIPLIIVFSIWESGYGVRYCTDFAWQFILGALCILFLLYVRRANEQTRRLIQYFMILSLGVALICNFGMVYDYIGKTGFFEASFLRFERIFEFWM